MYLQHSLLEEAIRDAAIELFYLHQLKSASLIWGNNQERQFNIYTCSFINTWLSNGYQNTRKILIIIIWYGAHCWTWWIEINDKYIFIFILYLKYYTICIYDWTQFLSFNISFSEYNNSSMFIDTIHIDTIVGCMTINQSFRTPHCTICYIYYS